MSFWADMASAHASAAEQSCAKPAFCVPSACDSLPWKCPKPA